MERRYAMVILVAYVPDRIGLFIFGINLRMFFGSDVLVY